MSGQPNRHHRLLSNIGGSFTVAELLADADRTARLLLGSDATVNGSSLLAGWPTILTAAHIVLICSPRFSATDSATGPGGETVGELVNQLAEEARAVGANEIPSRVHPALLRISESWHQAAAARRQPGDLAPVDSSADVLVAARVVRTLAVVAHATVATMHGSGPAKSGGIAPRLAGLDRDEAESFRRLMQRHERLTLRSLSLVTSDTRAPGASDPPDAIPDGAVGALAECVRGWAPAAIVAAADPTTSTRDLRAIAHTADILTAGSAGLLHRAAGPELTPEAVPHLQRRLELAAEHWNRVADQWGWIRRRGTADPSPLLRRSSLAVVDAIADAQGRAPDQGGPAPDTQPAIGRGDNALDVGSSLVPVVLRITEETAILAEIYARLPERTHRHDSSGRLRPVLFAPPRFLQQVAHDVHARDQALFRPGAQVSPDVLPVPLTSAHGESLQALTPDAVALLQATGTQLARAATAAERALELATDNENRQRARPLLSSTHPPLQPPQSPHISVHPLAPETGIAR